MATEILNSVYYSLVNIVHIIVLFLLLSVYWNAGLVFMESISIVVDKGMARKIVWGCFWPIILFVLFIALLVLIAVITVGFMIFIFCKIFVDIFMIAIGNKKHIASDVNIRTIFNGGAFSSFMSIVQNF